GCANRPHWYLCLVGLPPVMLLRPGGDHLVHALAARGADGGAGQADYRQHARCCGEQRQQGTGETAGGRGGPGVHRVTIPVRIISRTAGSTRSSVSSSSASVSAHTAATTCARVRVPSRAPTVAASCWSARTRRAKPA